MQIRGIFLYNERSKQKPNQIIKWTRSDRIRAVNITQGRTISTKRFLHKDETIGTERLVKVIQAFKNQFI